MTINKALMAVLAECGIDNVNPSVNGSDFEMRQLKALLNAAGSDIATRTEWSGAIKKGLISAGTQEMVLSDYFQEMAEAGAVFLTDGTPIRAIVDPGVWSFLKSRNSTQIYYHLSESKLHFSKPLPTDADMVFVSKAWLKNGSTEIKADDDQPIFPWELLARGTIYRWKRQKGLPYDDLLAEFEADLEAAIKADRGVQ